MKVIENELIVVCDVDETLVLHNVDSPYSGKSPKLITCPYSGDTLRVYPHTAHINMIKDKKTRGWTVIVWSQGGYKWAEAVVKALNLQDSVDLILTKPNCYVDDLPAEAWIGSRIYLKPDFGYKRE